MAANVFVWAGPVEGGCSCSGAWLATSRPCFLCPRDATSSPSCSQGGVKLESRPKSSVLSEYGMKDWRRPLRGVCE